MVKNWKTMLLLSVWHAMTGFSAAAMGVYLYVTEGWLFGIGVAIMGSLIGITWVIYCKAELEGSTSE